MQIARDEPPPKNRVRRADWVTRVPPSMFNACILAFLLSACVGADNTEHTQDSATPTNVDAFHPDTQTHDASTDALSPDSGMFDMSPSGSVLDGSTESDVGVADAEVAPALVWRDVTHNRRGGHNEWLAGNGFALSPRQPDGFVYRLHVPEKTGPGLRVERLIDGPAGEFVDLTSSLLPSRWGRLASFDAGVFADLNLDGWSDIVVWGQAPLGTPECFMYDPAAQRFRPAGLSRASTDITTFFGGTPGIFEAGSKHVNRAISADLDNDGDEDIFLARSTVNAILENLTVEGDQVTPWTHADIRRDGDNGPVIPRFRIHMLESKTTDIDNFRNTQAAALINVDGQNMILAADRVCDGEAGCARQREITRRACPESGACPALERLSLRMVHLYAFTGAETGVENGVCETDESSQPDHPDCAGQVGAYRAVSYRFTDRLRRLIPGLNASAVAAVRTGRADVPIELLFMGGAAYANRRLVKACFGDDQDPGCAALLETMASYKISIRDDQSLGPEVRLGRTLLPPFYRVDVSVSVDLNDDGVSELVVGSRASMIHGSSLTILRRSDDAWRAESPENAELDRDESITDIALGDFDGDGLMDLMTSRQNGYPILFGQRQGDEVTFGWDRRLPLQSTNMKRPVFADFDLDGDLDLAVKTWTDWPSDPNELFVYVNDGDGAFALNDDLVDWAGAREERLGYYGMMQPIDVDLDGDPDLVSSQDGPFLVLENRWLPDGALRFVDRPDWVPAGYGGQIAGERGALSPRPCLPNDGNNAGERRCTSFHLTVGDLDGNGADDVAFVIRNGANDILFNNIGGEVCDLLPWCPRRGFLSARYDLGLSSVLPSNTDRGRGFLNQAQAVHTVQVTNDGEPPDLVVMLTGDAANQQSALRFSNEIERPFPHGVFCQSDGDCPGEGQVCQSRLQGTPAGPSFQNTSVCVSTEHGEQVVVNGWLRPMDSAFPARGSTRPPESRYRSLGCGAVGDLNGDGHDDFILASAVGDAAPDMDGAFTVGAACPALEAVCDQVFQCTPALCDAQRWDPDDPFAWEKECCQRFSASSDQERFIDGVFIEPDCFRNADEPEDKCFIRGNRLIDPPMEGHLFAYVWRPDQRQFVEYSQILDHPGFPGATIKDCTISDLNDDGLADIALAGYLTGDPPAALATHPVPLLTNPHTYELRRHKYALTTSVWLNQGVQGDGTLRTFRRGDLPPIADKIYHIVAADIDGSGRPELITSGGAQMTIYSAIEAPESGE